jgi:hypothetical protein
LSAVGDYLFNIFAATLHTGVRSSIHKLRTRHAFVRRVHLSRIIIYLGCVLTERVARSSSRTIASRLPLACTGLCWLVLALCPHWGKAPTSIVWLCGISFGSSQSAYSRPPLYRPRFQRNSVIPDSFFIPRPFPYALSHNYFGYTSLSYIGSSVTSDFSDIPQHLVILGLTVFGVIMDSSQRLQCVRAQRAHSSERHEDCTYN